MKYLRCLELWGAVLCFLKLNKGFWWFRHWVLAYLQPSVEICRLHRKIKCFHILHKTKSLISGKKIIFCFELFSPSPCPLSPILLNGEGEDSNNFFSEKLETNSVQIFFAKNVSCALSLHCFADYQIYHQTFVIDRIQPEFDWIRMDFPTNYIAA